MMMGPEAIGLGGRGLAAPVRARTLRLLKALLAVVARLLLAYIFVVEGLGKIGNYAATAQYMEQFHVPGALLPLVILTELGGGLAVAFGLLTRWAAFALAGFALLTALFFHSDFGDPEQLINFQKNLAIAGGFLVLVVHGPGAWSLDALLRRRRLLDLRPRALGSITPSAARSPDRTAIRE